MSFRVWKDCPYCGGAGWLFVPASIAGTAGLQKQCPVCAKVCGLQAEVKRLRAIVGHTDQSLIDTLSECDRLKAALKEIEDYSCPAGCDVVARVALDSAKEGDA